MATSKKSSRKTSKKAKKSTAKKKTKKKAATKKAAKKKAVSQKTTKKKTTAKKAATKKSTKKTTKKKTAAKKVTTKKATKKKTAAKKATTEKTPKKKVTTDLSGVFTPLDDRVLVQKAERSDTTPGGIVIPDTVSDRPNRGTVMAVGRGRRNKKGQVRPMDVQVGDNIFFQTYAGSEITIGDASALILHEDDILGVVS